MTNQELIEKFYSSFQNKDYEGMKSCYHEEVEFSDPVFIGLKGKEPGAMWHMLCNAGSEVKISYDNIQISENQGSVHWEAEYEFSETGRFVHNKIDASFLFSDGKIIKHTDKFDLWKWTRMALGFPGLIFGWSPIIKGVVRKKAGGKLKRFIEKNTEYQN